MSAVATSAWRRSEPWLRAALERARDVVSGGWPPNAPGRAEDLEFDDVTLDSDPDLGTSDAFDPSDLEVTLAAPLHGSRPHTSPLSSAPPPPRRSHMASEPTSPYSRPAPPPPAPSSAPTSPRAEPAPESWEDADPWDAPESSHGSSYHQVAPPHSGDLAAASSGPPSGTYQSAGSMAPFSLTRHPEPIPRSAIPRGPAFGRTHMASGRALFTSGAAAGIGLAVLGAWSIPRIGERVAALGADGDESALGFSEHSTTEPGHGPSAFAARTVDGEQMAIPANAVARHLPAGSETSSSDAPPAGVQRVEDLPEVKLEDLMRVPVGSRPSCESQLRDWTPSELGSSRALASQHRRGGQMYLLGGRNDLAEIELCKSVTYEPAGPGAPLLATLYLTERSPEAARTVLTRALELDPNADELRELLGDALSQLGRTTEARAEWLAALHLGDESDRRVREVSRHWVRTSVAVRRSGDLARAERLLRRSVTLDPDSETAARLLAEAFERQGDTGRADAWYAHALTL